jgi:hypothetical protein
MEVAMIRRFLCWFLALLFWAGAATGQTAQADKIRQQVGKIGALGNITVDVKGGPEYYGSVRRIGSDDFSIDEVDQRREITLRYSEVKRVRADYGTTRNIRGRRIHPHTRLIVMLAVVGGLLTLIFVAVASDKS